MSLQISAGLLRRDDAVLLVRQQGRSDPSPYWSIPGGVAEAGELPHEALVREVREETGLEITNPGGLLYVSCHVIPMSGAHSTTFVFEVASWQGDLRPHDPDSIILDVRFFPLQEAVDRLLQLPWPMMRDPLIAHVRGDADPGSLWLYQTDAEFPTLVERLAPPKLRASRSSQ